MRASLYDETRLDKAMALQAEAERTIEEQEQGIERVSERLNSPFKMKARDRRNSYAEIAERKEGVGKAREQWAKCKAEMGEELGRWKVESKVEIKLTAQNSVGYNNERSCISFSTTRPS